MVRRRTPKNIVFLNATTRARVVYECVMNLRAKILVVICAKLSKMGCVYEQIHVHLLSRLLEHIQIYFLHQ